MDAKMKMELCKRCSYIKSNDNTCEKCGFDVIDSKILLDIAKARERELKRQSEYIGLMMSIR